jgi:hypothetical protein
MAVALVALLGTSALVMDVGFSWYAKRQVQASADAAALAGAQELPDTTAATATALDYYNRNKPDNLSSTPAPTIKVTCAPVTSFLCTQTTIQNTIQVTATASTPAWFGRVLGFSNFNVKGIATACQPCSSTPVDVMLVIDRTGSMCSPTGTNSSCTDLDNAKTGVQTMLNLLDPTIDRVGLVAFPGYVSTDKDGVCGDDQSSTELTINGVTNVDPNNYDTAGPASPQLIYLDDALSNDFKTSATATSLNQASPLVQHVRTDLPAPDLYGNGKHNCIQSMGSTSYADALQAGEDELIKDGRKNVPHIIVFMTDGEANMGSYQPGVAFHGLEPSLDNYAVTGDDMPGGAASLVNPGDAQPCHTAINTAAAIKNDGVIIYSIGYALGVNVPCVHGVWGQYDKSDDPNGNTPSKWKCVMIGSIPTGKYASKSWATTVIAGHYQGIYSPGPNNGGNNTNPCTNDPAHQHQEMPAINSDYTVQAIGSPGDFYNKPAEGQLKTIFASIAADITNGTSRLVDDSYGN